MNPSDQNQSNDLTAQRDFRLLFACLVVFFLGNVGLMSVREFRPYPFDSRWLRDGIEAILTGAIGAQIGLHAIWTIFSRGGLPRRVLASGMSALALFLSIFGVVLLSDLRSLWANYAWTSFQAWLLSTPAVLLSVQVPLWACKAGLRWRIVHSRDPLGFDSQRPLSIGGLMVATAAVACCLACIRLANYVPNGPPPTEYNAAVGIIAGIALLLGLFTVVPKLYASLRMRRPILGCGIAFILDVLILGALIAVASISQGPPPLDMIWMFGAMLFTFASLLAGPLLITRRLGYRLRTVRDRCRAARVPVHDDPTSNHETF